MSPAVKAVLKGRHRSEWAARRKPQMSLTVQLLPIKDWKDWQRRRPPKGRAFRTRKQTLNRFSDFARTDPPPCSALHAPAAPTMPCLGAHVRSVIRSMISRRNGRKRHFRPLEFAPSFVASHPPMARFTREKPLRPDGARAYAGAHTSMLLRIRPTARPSMTKGSPGRTVMVG